MSCEVYRSALIEMARGAGATPGLAAHLAGCRACRRHLDIQLELTAALVRASGEASVVNAPSGLEQALLAEFSRVRKPRVSPIARWLPAAAGLIAAMTIAGWVASHRGKSTEGPATISPMASSAATPVVSPAAPSAELKTVASATRTHTARQVPVADNTDQEQPFIEVPYTLPLEPGERADLMRVEMPVSALIAAGMPVGVADPAARARADVIVGQDGRARAFRIISVSTFNTDRSFNHE